MKYAGLELENFDKAHIWRKYIYFLIKKYMQNDFLEVGAGIGSFTKNYLHKLFLKHLYYLKLLYYLRHMQNHYLELNVKDLYYFLRNLLIEI